MEYQTGVSRGTFRVLLPAAKTVLRSLTEGSTSTMNPSGRAVSPLSAGSKVRLKRLPKPSLVSAMRSAALKRTLVDRSVEPVALHFPVDGRTSQPKALRRRRHVGVCLQEGCLDGGLLQILQRHGARNQALHKLLIRTR